MTTGPPNTPDEAALRAEIEDLRARLADAEEALRAIRAGEVDALVVAGPHGDRVYTLSGADEPYRVLIEEMGEGAATLSADGMVLYANPRFAVLMGRPALTLAGRELTELVAVPDRARLGSVLESLRGGREEDILELASAAADTTLRLSLKVLRDAPPAAFSLVVTDLSDRHAREAELRRAHEQLESDVAARTAELAAANEALRRSRTAALNMMEDAVAARGAAERFSADVARQKGLLDAVLDSPSGIFIFALDGDHRYTTFNEPHRREMRRTWAVEIAIGDEMPALISLPGSQAAARQSMDRALRGEAFSETRVQPGGAVHELNWNPIRDADGRVVGVTCFGQDVTAILQATEALRQSEEKARAAFANTAIGFAMTTPEGRFVDTNPAFSAITGHGADELRALPFLDLVHPEDRDRNAALNARMLAGDIDDFVVENRYVRKDGGTVWVRKSVSLVRDAHGRPHWLLALVEDISERKRADEELARRQSLLDAVVEGTQDAFFVKDLDGTVLLANPATVAVVGKPLEQIVGHRDDEFYDDKETAAAIMANDRRIMASGAAEVVEEGMATPDGSRTYLSSKSPWRDSQGNVIGLVGISRDITARKQSEEALRALADDLEVERGTLAAAIDNMEVGLVFTEADGTFLSMNAKALQMHGFDSGRDMFAQFERYAWEFELRYPDGRPLPLEDWPMSRALRGDYVKDYETRVHRRSGGDEWIGSYSASPVHGADGEIVMIVFSIFDLTVRRELQEQLRRELETSNVLLQATTALAQWTDAPETLEDVVRLIAAVTDHSRVGLHIWHAKDRKFELVAATGAGMPPIGTRTAAARLSAATRQAVTQRRTMVADIDEMADDLQGIAPEHGAHLSLSVPVVHRGELVGLLALDEPGERRPFTDRQIELAEGIAAQAGVAIENAGLFEAQRRIATVLQEQFIHPLPEIEGLEFAVVSETAHQPERIGGDFHDVFELPNGLVAVLLGDVEGKGVSAAALSETVRSAIRALAIVSPSPRYVLNNVNRMLLQQHSPQFVTALLTILDPADGLALSASAGHPAGILVGEDGVSSVAMQFGVPLGALPWDHEQTSYRLRPGDSLVLYTDGVSEARRDKLLFGEEGVVETLKTVTDRDPAGIAQAVRDAATDYAGRLSDDLQLVVVRFSGRPAVADRSDRVSNLSLIVPEAPWRLVDIRGSVRDFLTAHAVAEDAVDDLVMCVEEACTNALRHSGSAEPTEVRLSVDRAVVDISVRDRGRGFDTQALDLSRLPDPLALSGRGLYLIRSVVDELELLCVDGTTVHLRKYRDHSGGESGP